MPPTILGFISRNLGSFTCPSVLQEQGTSDYLYCSLRKAVGSCDGEILLSDMPGTRTQAGRVFHS